MSPPPDVVATPMRGRTLAPAGSDLVLAEWRAEPGSPKEPQYQAPLHVHHDDDEAWYVLEGRLRIRVGEGEYDVPAGSALVGPHGLPHTFWNPDPVPARYLLVMSARTHGLLQALHGGGRRSGEELRGLFERYGCQLLE